MVRLDRIEFAKLLVSVFAGIFAGNIARGYFGDQIAGLFATVAVLVVVYGALDRVDKYYRHRGKSS